MRATKLCRAGGRAGDLCGWRGPIRRILTRRARRLRPAARKRIHTFIATSPIHMEHKLRKKPDQVLKMAVEAIRMARQYTDDVEFSPEDACRSEMGFCTRFWQRSSRQATTLNIPDTVGYVLPYEYGQIIANLKQNVRGVEKAVLSTHCHNDLGVATANSLAGVRNGARQIECTINGIGERAGNAAMEEVVMALHTRQDFFEHVTTNIQTREIFRTSQLVSQLTGFVIQPNKAIVGKNAFAHESGIHVDGILKHRETYEIMTPEVIGLSGSTMVLGRHSGRAGFIDRCRQLGYNLSDDEIQSAYEKFLEIADKKKEIFDEDIAAIINDEVRTVSQTYVLEYLNVTSGTGTIPTGTVRIRTQDGAVHQAAACGDGPVDAAYEAIRLATGQTPQLEHYTMRAITGGKEAMGEANVRVKGADGRTYIGRGVSTDIVEASAKAYLDAINRIAACVGTDNAEKVSL